MKSENLASKWIVFSGAVCDEIVVLKDGTSELEARTEVAVSVVRPSPGARGLSFGVSFYTSL